MKLLLPALFLVASASSAFAECSDQNYRSTRDRVRGAFNRQIGEFSTSKDCTRIPEIVKTWVEGNAAIDAAARAGHCGAIEKTAKTRDELEGSLKAYCSGGKGQAATPSKGPCKIMARAVTRTEQIAGHPSSYEEIVADNECDTPVKFEFTSANSFKTTKRMTRCVPARSSNFSTGSRSSSIEMSRLSVGKHQNCN